MDTAKTFFIRPTVPFKSECSLNLLDYLAPFVYTPYLLIYENDPSLEVADYRNNLVELLKESLQNLLQQPVDGVTSFAVLLSTIDEDDNDGRLCLRVNEMSSIKLLVCHREDITLEQLRPDLQYPQSYLPPEVFAQGLREVVIKDASKGVPVFWAQVTFIQGGFVIMINLHHAICDGTATGVFIEMWLQKLRELRTNNQQVCETAKLASTLSNRQNLLQSTSVIAKAHPELLPSPSSIGVRGEKLVPTKTIELDRQLFHLHSDALSQLRNIAPQDSNIKVSTNDVVCALTWRCITRARFGHLSKFSVKWKEMSRLSFARDVRQTLKPPIPRESITNAVYPVCVDRSVDHLMDTQADTLIAIAGSIRDAIVNIDNPYLQSAFNSLAPRIPWRARRSDVQNRRGNDLFISSLAGIFKSAEVLQLPGARFRAFRIPARTGSEGLVMIQPTFGNRDMAAATGGFPGGIELYVELEKEHMENLRRDSEWLTFATWAENGGYHSSGDDTSQRTRSE